MAAKLDYRTACDGAARGKRRVWVFPGQKAQEEHACRDEYIPNDQAPQAGNNQVQRQGDDQRDDWVTEQEEEDIGELDGRLPGQGWRACGCRVQNDVGLHCYWTDCAAPGPHYPGMPWLPAALLPAPL